jgi:hypothetical protein
MIKNIIITGILILTATIMYSFITKPSDVISAERQQGGGYYFVHRGSRIWVNRSFREGSLSGRYRGGGPHSGK